MNCSHWQNSTEESSDAIADTFKKLGINISDTPFHIPLSELRQNVVPSEVEKQDVLNHVKKAENEKAYLNDSISVLEASLRHLKHVRDHVDAYISGQESLCAPIRNLPTEVLQKIFVTAFPVVSLHDSKEFPWRLGHVCSYWRDITLKFPNLWANIAFPTPLEFHDSTASRKLLREALILSKSSPLSIKFPRSPLSTDLPRLRPLFQLLSPHIHRVEKLALNVHTMLELCNNTSKFLGLRSMRLNGKPISPDGTSVITFDAPLLSDVELVGIASEGNLGGLQIPWEQLTRFRSDNFIPTYAFSRMEKLEHLVIPFANGYRLHDEYIFPSLRHLQLLHRDVPSIHLVEQYTAPNLDSFIISMALPFASVAASIGDVVTRFIKRSSCNISYLSLRGLSHEAIETILHHTPGVTTLRLTFSKGFETTPNLLRLRSSECTGEKTFLARLTSITIIFEHVWERQSLIEQLVEVIKSRLPTVPREEGCVAPLGVVNIYRSDLLAPSSLALLDRLKAETKDIRGFYFHL